MTVTGGWRELWNEVVEAYLRVQFGIGLKEPNNYDKLHVSRYSN
jgi:hypothetical protein